MAGNVPERNRPGMTPNVAGEARGMTDEIRGAAQDVAQEARAAGSSLRDDMSGLGSTLKQGLTAQVERQKNGIADRLSAVAERTQATAADLRENEAWLGNLLARGAEELEGVAEEIRANDVPGILGSVEVFARRQPALFMGATVGLGFALARFVGSGPTAAEAYGAGRGRWEHDRVHAAGHVRDPGIGGSNI